MTQTALPVDGSPALLDIASRFAEAKCLLTANEIGLFELLQAGQLTATEISVRLGIRAHAAPDFLSILVAVGVLG